MPKPTEHSTEEVESQEVETDKPEHCYNCGSKLLDEAHFCMNCGQKRGNKRVSFFTLVNDFLGDFFSWDSKFFRSIIPLSVKPGFLTNEFIKGKKIRYIPPIRLYVFLSFIYFLILSATGGGERLFSSDSGGKSIATISTTEGNSVETTSILELKDIEIGNEEEITSYRDSLYRIVQNDTDTIEHSQWSRFSNGWILLLSKVEPQEIIDSLGINTFFHQQLIYQSAKLKDNPHKYVQDTIKNFSVLLFILMPVFALILKLLYIRRKFFYVDHVIFSFHYHAFIFLILLLILLAGQLTWLVAILILYIWIYLFIALRKVYKQGFFKTLFKYWTLQILYGIALLIGITATFALTFYLF